MKDETKEKIHEGLAKFFKSVGYVAIVAGLMGLVAADIYIFTADVPGNWIFGTTLVIMEVLFGLYGLYLWSD